jgi:choice-of-anchor B domain-containing protein
MSRFVMFAFFLAVGAMPLSNFSKHCTGACRGGDPNARMQTVMQMKLLEREECHLAGICPLVRQSEGGKLCADGMAGEFPCKNINLMSFTSLKDLGSSGEGNDIWGWTDSTNNREYAIMGCTDGTSFVDITNPYAPVPMGFLPSSNGRSSIWRDMKVYKDHAYIVADNSPNHGMQVVDLTQFRNKIKPARPLVINGNVSDMPEVEVVTLYSEFGSSHNIVINEDTGYAYSVGSDTCNSGLHVVDIRDPAKPEFAGCFGDDGYTHDAQCVVYNGPDEAYKGKEICFNYNEDTLTIVDVEDKSDMKMIARQSYQGYAYSHQGWLTEDHGYLLLDDELDEVRMNNDGHTQTYVWDVTTLSNPKIMGYHWSPVLAIDHNLYIKGSLAYQANYESGLRVVDVSKIPNKNLAPSFCDSTVTGPRERCNDGTICDANRLPCENARKCMCPTFGTEEVAFFDVRPERNDIQFFGSWSVYPYFPSGAVIVSSIERGLFVLDPTAAEAAAL